MEHKINYLNGTVPHSAEMRIIKFINLLKTLGNVSIGTFSWCRQKIYKSSKVWHNLYHSPKRETRANDDDNEKILLS